VPTYRLDLAYDGSDFRGFARQRVVRTVQGELEAALERIFGEPVDTVCAGRTDAGVHARGQVVSFKSPTPVDTERVTRALRSMLAPEVVALTTSLVADGFSARFSAVWREYRYRVLNAPVADPLRRHTTWQVADPLEIGAMQRAAAEIVGEHDFSSFCRSAPDRSNMRRVLEADWYLDGDLTTFRIRASAFCHQMVRSLVGHFVDVGRGRAEPEDMGDVLARRDRSAARPMAPARGLILWEVGYP